MLKIRQIDNFTNLFIFTSFCCFVVFSPEPLPIGTGADFWQFFSNGCLKPFQAPISQKLVVKFPELLLSAGGHGRRLGKLVAAERKNLEDMHNVYGKE